MNLAKRLHELHLIDIEIQGIQGTLNEICNQLGKSEILLEAEIKLIDTKKHFDKVNKFKKDLDWEVETLHKNISQLKNKLYSGKISNPKELQNLEQEMHSFINKLKQREDELLELMADEEVTQNKIEAGNNQFKIIEKEWKREQSELAEEKVELEDQLSDLTKKHQFLTMEIDPRSLELYESIKARTGQPVVKVEQGRCQGCRITLPMNEWQRARSGTLVQCSSCGKILYLG